MNGVAKAFLLAAIILAAFLAGVSYKGQSSANTTPLAPRVLYYHDPMHPSYKSDKPGIAPDCGMQLEPVYSEAGPAAPPLPRGAVEISPEKQRMIGVEVRAAENVPARHSLRTVGRVAADETRIFRLNTSTEGWIRETFPNSVGSLVKKNEPLAAFYSPEFLSAQQAYFYALGALDRFQASGQETAAQIQLTKANIQQAADTLHNLGMGDIQIEEIRRTRQFTQKIFLYAPSAGFLMTRNISPGQKFEKGTELFRIADLSRIWVLADLYENESEYIRPGDTVRVQYHRRSFPAKMSKVLPQFDPATRTLKVRFELDNPGYVLRPEMFVDIEYPVNLPAAVTVPADAVLDSGLRKTVFVERAPGVFEPRRVEVLWRFGDRVGIGNGLLAGERVVVSGNFLLDSESRMKLAATAPAKTTDPVCGMEVDPAKAQKAQHGGATYYFCSAECKRSFERDPQKYTRKKA